MSQPIESTLSIDKITHSIQRQYTLLEGHSKDHAGDVQVRPIPNFDLDQTIFTTLEGKIPRLFMQSKIAKTVHWNADRQQEIDKAYTQLTDKHPSSPIQPEILAFMTEYCNFNAEHADGSFLEHLLYGYDYAQLHYPNHSANVMLLHSILGTATNTFAMPIEHLDKLAALLSEFEFLHIAAFPSFLRLMYTPEFFQSLKDNHHRIKDLKGIRFHRVIDNAPMEMDAENLWIQLNYHLMHFVDFLPVANWSTHFSDPLLQMFLQLSNYLDSIGQRQATVNFTPPTTSGQCIGEELSFGSKLSNWVPISLKMKLTTKSIRRFSSRIGHSMDFTLLW